MRNRYAFTVTLEVPGATYADAIERGLRLFRPQVRGKLRETVTYSAAYKGSWFAMSRLSEPPKDRVKLTTRKRALRVLPRDVPAPAPAVVANPAPRRRVAKPIRGTQRALFEEVAAT